MKKSDLVIPPQVAMLSGPQLGDRRPCGRWANVARESSSTLDVVGSPGLQVLQEAAISVPGALPVLLCWVQFQWQIRCFGCLALRSSATMRSEPPKLHSTGQAHGDRCAGDRSVPL